jgi:predicted CopG family antitoxin
MKFGDEFFKKVEKKTNVSKDTILSLAEKLQKGNMKDEKTLSEVIDTLSKMTGKKVSDVELAEAIFGIEPNEAIVVEDKVPNNVEKMF